MLEDVLVADNRIPTTESKLNRAHVHVSENSQSEASEKNGSVYPQASLWLREYECSVMIEAPCCCACVTKLHYHT